MPWTLAIDFGTTATAAAVTNADTALPMILPDGASTLASSVLAEDDGLLVVGAEADNEAEMRLDSYEPTPKRRVGEQRVRLGGREYLPAELIAAVLGAVLSEAVRQHDLTAPSAVRLTHPVLWRAPRRQILGEAFSRAMFRLGIETLPEPTFVSEPVAAAHWYARRERPRIGEYFGVYDLGGGTFDTTVLRITDDGYEVAASGGIDRLGGFDFDYLLFKYLGDKYIAAVDAGLWADLSGAGQFEPDLARKRRQLQERVRRLKEALSHEPEKRIRLPGVRDQVLVTRGEYEELISEHIEATVSELEDTIAAAGLSPQDLTAIYRIGGASRTPLVGAVLDRLQLPVPVIDQPKLVVAQGAALAPESAITIDEPSLLEARSEQWFGDAQDALRDGDETTVIAGYRQVIARAHYELGEIHRTHNRLQQAAAEYSAAVGADATPWTGLATAALERVAAAHLPKSARRQESPTIGRSAMAIDAALKGRVARAGIDPDGASGSQLILRPAQGGLARLTVQHAEFRVDGRIGLMVDKRSSGKNSNPHLSNLSNYVISAERASRWAGWVLMPPHHAPVAGIPGGLMNWQTLTTPDGARRNVLRGFAEKDRYLIACWFDESSAGLINRTYIDTPAGGMATSDSQGVAPFAVAFIVDGAAGVIDDEVTEKVQAAVTYDFESADIAATLSPKGVDLRTAAESVKADLSLSGGYFRIADEPDTFLDDAPCLAYRFEYASHHAVTKGQPARLITAWAWVGEIDGRVLTVTVRSQSANAPVEEIRDLVQLAPITQQGSAAT